MTTVEYDLDTSGGIMPEIQALIGPPSTEDSSKRPKKESQRYRRPGKTINHDCCDSCKEGGDLICCDRCPAAFHLQCYNPPLKEEDVPTGEWICHQCNIAKMEDKTPGSNNVFNKNSVPNKVHPKGSYNDLIMEEKPSNGLQLLVKAASTMNPKQFQLPNEYTCPTQFPGASKRPRGKDGRTNHKKLAHELDNGIVPLPAKLCHVCKKSCRVGPLIQCDFCTLLFHLDCLDPPLTTVPPNKWMCPNHAEQIIDQKLLTTLSITERVKLWDKFAGPVSQDAVKMEFFKKIHRRKPPFRYRVKLAQRQRVQVPNAIKEHYKCPPPLLPRVTESPAPLPNSSTATSPQTISQEEQEEWLSSMVAFQVGVAKYLAQKNIVKTTGATSISNDTITTSSSSSFSFKHNDNVRIPITSENSNTSSSNKVVMNGGSIFVIPPSSESKVTFSTSHASSLTASTKQSVVNKSFVNHQNVSAANFSAFNGDLEEGKSPGGHVEVKTEDPGASPASVCYSCLNCNTVNTNTLSWSSPPATSVTSSTARTVATTSLKPMPKKEPLPNNTLVKGGTVRSLITNGNKVALIQGNSNTISNSPRILTLQTTCGKSVSTKVSVATSLGNSPAILNLNSNLQACIEGVGEVELNKLDERLVKILAWQRLQQLLPAKTVLLSNSKKPLNGYSTGASNAQARAIICPLTGKGISIPMPYRKLTIGMGADMDVCLSNYGHCNFISAKHACVFYDEITKHYELLNYSEHGTTVDNVLYSCDFSEKHVPPPPASPLAANVRKLSGTTSPTTPPASKSSDNRNVAPRPTEIWKPCNCKVSSSCLIGGSGAGWEGTAILHHGSYIKCGCLQFIFSILDQAKPAGNGGAAPEISVLPSNSDSKPNQKSS